MLIIQKRKFRGKDTKDMSYTVYKHTFPNGKVYIGITRLNTERRWSNGTGYLKKKNGKYCQPLMANAVLKYKWEDIRHEILFYNLTKKEAEQKEIELITFYKSNDDKFGYNLEHGGNSIGKVSEETKKKIGSFNKGKVLSEETKRKISESQKGENGYWYGKNQPDEANIKRSQSLKSFYENNTHHNVGKHLSEEHKEKIRLGNLGKKVSEESIKKRAKTVSVKVRCVETGVIYDSIKYVREELGVQHVWACCNGKRKTACGYHWEYVNNNNKNKKKTVTESTKEKLKEAVKNKMQVRCIETNIVYCSQSEASRQTGISQSSISSVCRGETITAGGYHWELVEANNN